MSSAEPSNSVNTNHAQNASTNNNTRWKNYKQTKNNINEATPATKAPRDHQHTPVGPRGTTTGKGYHDSTRFAPRSHSHQPGTATPNAPGQQAPPQHPRAAYSQQRRARPRRFQQYPRKADATEELTSSSPAPPAPPAGPAAVASTSQQAPAPSGGVKDHDVETAHHTNAVSSLGHAKQQKKKRNGKHNKRKSDGSDDAVDALEVASLSLSVTKHLGTQQINAKLDGGASVTVKDVPHTVHTILPESHLDFNPGDIRVSLPGSAATTVVAPVPDEPVLLHKKTLSSLSMADSIVSRSPSPARSPTLLSRDVSVTPPLIDRQMESERVKQVEKKKSSTVIVDSSTVNKNKAPHYRNSPTGPEYYGSQYPVYQPYPNDPALYPVSYDTTPALMPYPYMVNNSFPPPPPHMVGGPMGFAPDEDKGIDASPMVMAPNYLPNVPPGPQYGYYPYDPNGAYSYQYTPPPF